MNKLFFIILTSFIIQLSIYGQHDFGFKLNGGRSSIRIKLPSHPSILTREFYFVPSGQAGFYYNHNLKKKFSISSELLFTQIEGRQFIKFQLVDSTGSISPTIFENTYFMHISYLGIPVYFGYNYKKLNINGGIQMNLRLTSNQRETSRMIANGNTITSKMNMGKMSIDGYDYGMRFGFVFRITEKVSVESNYYYSWNNILKDKEPSKTIKYKVQQITIGVRRRLYNIEKK